MHAFCVFVSRDVKCILELDFTFRIHTLSLCEEFLVCASTTECQTVQLNFRPNVNGESSSEEKELLGSSQFVELSAGSDVLVANTRNSRAECRNHLYEDAEVITDARNGTIADRVTGFSGAVQSSANDVNLRNCEGFNGYSRSSPFSHEARLRQEFAHFDLAMSQTDHECDELFVGPVEGSRAPCPVSVEFEGIIFLFFVFVHLIFCFNLCILCTFANLVYEVIT